MNPGARAAAIALALALTLALGTWMRGFLDGAWPLNVDFGHVRHAHSHLGYYGVLFPLAWLGWRAAGASTPGRRTVILYGLAVVVSLLGFLRAGYGPEAIAASTVVGAIWLGSAWAIRRRMADARDPLGAVPLAVVLAEACIPPIALTLRRDPALAHGFVASFLCVILLGVMVPSALAATRARTPPWPLLLGAAALAAVALGVWPSPVTAIGLLAYAALLGWSATGALPHHLRASWGAVALGLAAVGVGLLPNTRPVALAAIHFLVLGPVLGSLAPSILRVAPPIWAWWTNHVLAAGMALALVLQAFGAGAWTATAAALAGAGTAVWWLVTLVSQRPWVPSGMMRAGGGHAPDPRRGDQLS